MLNIFMITENGSKAKPKFEGFLQIKIVSPQ